MSEINKSNPSLLYSEYMKTDLAKHIVDVMKKKNQVKRTTKLENTEVMSRVKNLLHRFENKQECEPNLESGFTADALNGRHIQMDVAVPNMFDDSSEEENNENNYSEECSDSEECCTSENLENGDLYQYVEDIFEKCDVENATSAQDRSEETESEIPSSPLSNKNCKTSKSLKTKIIVIESEELTDGELIQPTSKKMCVK